MKDITAFIIEAKKSEQIINFDEFNDEIEKLNKEFKYYSFGVFDDEGEHLYIHPKDSKKWYTAVPDKFRLDQWTIGDIVKAAPKLCETLYVAVKTFELPNHQSRVNGIIKHYARPVLTHQGMFFNSDKECKQFIKAVKNELRPDNGEVKKYKLTPMTVKEFVDFLNAETKKGSYYSYEHQDTQFVKYEG
jgi:hypothetical protein